MFGFIRIKIGDITENYKTISSSSNYDPSNHITCSQTLTGATVPLTSFVKTKNDRKIGIFLGIDLGQGLFLNSQS
jgi:hypothetical protein